MPERFAVTINGIPGEFAAGTSVAAAMLAMGAPCRISIGGEPRTALCGMGICFECRAIVDGTLHRRTCQLLCSPGMQVETQR
jgi:hypothetical protein